MGGLHAYDDNQKQIWPEPALVFDLLPIGYSEKTGQKTVHMLSTEFGTVYKLDLKVKPDVPAGIHKIDFILTYYNGTTWDNSEYTVELTVPSKLQRRESVIWPLATLIVLFTLVEFIFTFFQFVVKNWCVSSTLCRAYFNWP
jgi:hypothetical protein